MRLVSSLTVAVLIVAAIACGCGTDLAQRTGKEDAYTVKPSNGGERRVLFVHHSCGSGLMRSGLVAALEDLRNPYSKGQYSFHEAEYGSHLGEGDGSLGRYTDQHDWYVKFREDLDRPGDLVDMLNCKHQDETYTDGGENTIIMFKSCYPNSDVEAADTSIELDDAAVRAAWLDPDQGGYYNGLWEEGVGGPINYIKAAYLGLLDIFRENPDRLFIAVTTPALHYGSTNPEQAARARELNDWLRTEWLKGYTDKNGRVNVAVFDWYAEHAYSDNPEDANYWRNFLGKPGHEELTEENHSQRLNTLRLDYASPDGNSHPNDPANKRLVKVFVEQFIGLAYEAWRGG
ncbi:MAG: hypothetical protein MUQ65_04795 [Armatimonadetes bacterium]|nr:hypothetical protein [Armatimonadota bacterium]